MSDLGTRIICAGLVDDGITVEDLEREVISLRALVASKKPVCPICSKEMRPVNFKGYYESFSFWACECESFTDATEARGAYA